MPTKRTTQRKTGSAARKTSGAARKSTKKVARSTKKIARNTKKVARNTKKVARNTKKVARKTTKHAAKEGTAPRKRPASGRDAIAVLKQDHREVEQLFKRFEKAGDDAHRSKRRLVDKMIEELSRHAGIEELVFYPAVRRDVDDAESDVLEALEEHHVVKLVLHELEDLDASDERFDAKVTVMMENVRHHVKEEEQELFPEVRGGMERRRLLELGAALREAKPRVPTRPHPAAPDEPPGNVLVGGAVAAIDRARTAGKRAVDRVRDESTA